MFLERGLPDGFVRGSFAREVIPLLALAVAAAVPALRGRGLVSAALVLLVAQRGLEMNGTYPTLLKSEYAPPLPTLAKLRAGEPYRVVATGDAGVTNLDVEVATPRGERLQGDGTEAREVILGASSPLCPAQAGEHTIRLRMTAGHGAVAWQVLGSGEGATPESVAGTAIPITGSAPMPTATMPLSAAATCGLPPDPALLISAATGKSADRTAAIGVTAT